jgi:hypothetical protein
MQQSGRKKSSQVVPLVAIGLLFTASVVSAAAQASPWFAGQVANLLGVSTEVVCGEGGCCGGAGPR